MFEYDLETLSGKHVSLEIEDRMYIDGEFVSSEETFENECPSTGEILADVPIATEDQVDQAVQAADRASQEWRELDVFERRERVEAFADFLLEHQDELTKLDVADNGSSISRMKFDTEKGARNLKYNAGLATELKGETIPTGPNNHNFTQREPYGVVAGIIPFNHPTMFVAEKVAPAIVAGNGIVVKPSEFTPLSALYIGRLIDECDLFPDGLINIVTGFGETGANLVEHDDVRLVSMVGSPATGKKIMQGASKNLSPVLLELGGKNPFIVYPDADMDRVLDGLKGAMALPWQGQSCGSGTRLLVHEDAYDDVVPPLIDRLESVTIGDPFDESNTMGSVVSEPQFEKVCKYIDIAKEEGADVLFGGETVDEYDRGYYLEPTVFEVEPDMTIAHEETFGPVLSVMTWSEYDEMIEIANSTDYGLTASVWTNDLNTAHRAADDIESGYIWINQHGRHYIGAPFGGYKQSGIGNKEDISELLDHTRVKNINIEFSDDLTLAGGN
ncbi:MULTISPECIES: aldehyde dehydrogenase family protein [Natrialba]|uniref:Aldehyde dehydrogenase family protein n=1 Tax=Natrialba swarupiae TaxID=2448032 RepID=A0A5D5ANJ2_9EURY|nr:MULTISPECIES: aldehyde dehydrogenase family protein [Natrialba]MWV38435.1 aldehyde dehydrogenase family protein [Natrialba sp. INN-245]TYT62573.1 aldehyde dehydrogenase family protein [Natrialba swarupiae]